MMGEAGFRSLVVQGLAMCPERLDGRWLLRIELVETFLSVDFHLVFPKVGASLSTCCLSGERYLWCRFSIIEPNLDFQSKSSRCDWKYNARNRR